MSDAVKLKDPNAVLDYKFDWGTAANDKPWLASGETIASRTVTVASGITRDSDGITDSGKSVTVWLSGGVAGNDYTVTCRIVTSAARTDERTMTIRCRER